MKLPAAWVGASTAQTRIEAASKLAAPAAKATKVEARIDMSAEVAGAGLCPDCRKPMEPMVAAGIDTMTCMGCRISLPTQDPDDVVQDNAESVGEGADEGQAAPEKTAPVGATFDLY